MANHLGSQKNPLVLRRRSDLAWVTRNAYQPTPEQAQVDNYPMAHVIVGGLPITIETPKDYFRYGEDPKGPRWHVRMPAAYGYIKGTRPDEDGDAIDVYLGDESYRADELPVWVIDQVHAHNGKWNEHKCMLGFPDKCIVRSTYIRGFNDGKGAKRLGAMTRFTWDEFCWWVKYGNHKKPIAYHETEKSALRSHEHSPYGAGTCPCAKCSGKSGGSMDTKSPAVSDAKALGMLTGIWAKVMHRMTPEEKATMLADAASIATSELGKASDLLEHGDDGGRIGQVEDQWDGPPDDAVTVAHHHGPGSSAPSGAVNVGPTQAASGNGAEKMEGEYSRHAPQGGVQAATERLGREIAGVKGAMKAFGKAIEAQNAALAVLQSGTSATVDQTAISAAVSKALAESLDAIVVQSAKKAVKKALKKSLADTSETLTEDEIVAKAEKECDEDDKEHDGEKIKHEMEHEGKDEDEAKSMAAARLRVLARSRIKKARVSIAKAQTLSDKPLAVKALRKLAKSHLKKAQTYLAQAQATRDGKMGPSLIDLHDRLAKAQKARKGLAPAQSQNQDIWPATSEKPVGKAEDGSPTSADLARAMDQISKAAEGMGMLNASVGQLMATFGGKGPAAPDGSGQLPPVFALAKAGGDKIAGVEMQLAKMHEDNVISFDDVQNAKDVLMKARMGMLPDIVTTMVKRLPPSVQNVLNQVAA